MITSTLENLWAFVLSVPINLVIIGIICLILKIMGRTLGTLIRTFVGYFLICFLFSLFGLTLPSIPALANWALEICKNLFYIL